MSSKLKIKKKTVLSSELKAQKNEEAMIAGILEGSPDGIGVAVIRLECGCRKMAAVDCKGEAASKVVIYRDEAESICDACKKDNGAFARVVTQFIHWQEPLPDAATRMEIEIKVLGSYTNH
ncbi:MAG TPA: hypothetical protein DEQ20_09000 [Desulfobulbaceae bacterium]|nr:MAG: hypothetical protein A2520_06720 [Deltaproteobacteria bacterium RIFOXYD12_FULL_53_23]HCC55039.1 hypothetical protein [Desulfobulbaceae bacterium]